MNFIIYAGREVVNDFEVVSDDGLTGQKLDLTDTATFTVSTTGVNPVCVLNNIPMVLIDADNGIFELTLTSAQTSLLEPYLGFMEDEYAPIANYEGYLEFTLVSGNKSATIPIRVKTVPQCQNP